ncbi:hypothetical protein NE237_013894 [Protea cynaroides]|uniref:Reverse transcriptase zinc-binding domain-containing protein n=1 Tax=Protea cynaroides TaxID=273540 RepID=A0A9Q0GZI6_9MAGN|nr:hypothetical protein NE237_013894 [Protea cynaroides]
MIDQDCDTWGIHRDAKVSFILEGSQWIPCPNNNPSVLNFWNDLHQVKRCHYESRDLVMWNQSKSLSFSAKLAWNACRTHYPKILAFVAWRSVLDSLPTSDQIRKRNAPVNNGYCLCNSGIASVNHLFFLCLFSSTIWDACISKLSQSSRPPSSTGLKRNRRKFASKGRIINEVTHVVLKDAMEMVMINHTSTSGANPMPLGRTNTVFDVH